MNPLAVALLGYAGIAVASSLVVAAMLALGKSKLWMPFALDHVPAVDGELSPQEPAFLESRGKELAALGFRPILTHRLTNGARPLLARVWLDPTATIVCTAQGMATSKGWEARFLSMSSSGPADTVVTTRNLPTVSVFAEPPSQTVREVLEARTAEALLAVHRAAVADSGLVPVPQDEAAALDDSIRRYRKFCEFQEQRSLLRRDERRARWVGTLRAHARLVFGQLLPSAADFELPRVMRALLVGTVLPTAVVLYARRLGGGGYILSQAAVFASGFVASVLFTARAWPWALLLGGVPLFLSERIVPFLPAMALLLGTVAGNLITLQRRGLIASKPGGKRRMLLWMIVSAALTILLFALFSYVSGGR